MLLVCFGAFACVGWTADPPHKRSDSKPPAALKAYAQRVAKAAREHGPASKTASKTNADGLHLSLTAPQSILSGHAVPATLTVRNDSKKAMTYQWHSQTTEIAHFRFRVMHKSNSTLAGTAGDRVGAAQARWTEYGHRLFSPHYFDEAGKSKMVKLEPTQKLTRSVNLARYIDFSIPGSYTIVGQWFLPPTQKQMATFRKIKNSGKPDITKKSFPHGILNFPPPAVETKPLSITVYAVDPE